MSEVTNADIYGVLLDIKEDIGGLKSSASLHLKAIENHGERLGKLEKVAANQRGAAKVWTLVGSAVGSAAGAVLGWFFGVHHH